MTEGQSSLHHEARFISGQLYEVGFALSSILEVPEELSEFGFTFQVIPQNFELSIENTKPYVKTELDVAKNRRYS